MQTTALVIGGGATGTGVARDLALRGVDTTLVERGAFAAGTTGRSHGVLHSGARYAETDPDDAAACLAENRIIRDIAPGCVEATGGYFLQVDGDDPDYFERKRAACVDLGMSVETLSGDELRGCIPEATSRVERALAVPDAVVSPSRLVVANAAAAREAGATLHDHAPVEDIHVEGGTVDRVDVGGRLGETVGVDAVVNATGPWAERCGALAGVSVPMQPTRGVMVAVENPGVDAVLNRCRPPADGDIVVPRAEEAVLGTTSVPVDDPDDFERAEEEIERTITECAAMCPGVEAPIRRTYWGVRPLYAPDETGRNARAISRGFALLDHGDGEEQRSSGSGEEQRSSGSGEEQRSSGSSAAGFYTIVGGKLTTYRRMAEATADRVCDHLGVSATCRTAERSLPGSDDPDRLDALVEEFGVDAPADGV